MEMKLKFNNVCQACGRTRRKSELLYDTKDLKAYCSRIDECNDQHPNSYAEVLERGVTVEMIPFDKAADLYYDRWMENASPLQKKAVKLMETPTSVRVGDENLAKYLLKLQEAKSYKSMSETIMTIVREHREAHGEPEVLEKVEDTSKVTKAGTHKVEQPVTNVPMAQPSVPAPVFKPPVTTVTEEPEDDDMTF